jgi:putative ABC transport system permease protein
MKSYGALSGRYLKQQRKRSILTVIGIILSVALISAIGTMGQSMKDNMLRQAIYEQGSYHFAYPSGDKKLYDELKNNVLVNRIGVVKEGPQTELQDSFKLTLVEANADLFDLAPLHLQEGRWPQKPDEAVVEQWMLARLPGAPKVGGKAELVGPDGNKRSYTISGVLVNTRSGQQNAESNAYTLMDENALSSGKLMLFVTLKPGVDISSHLEAFAKLGDPFAPNNQVLAYMGESSDDDFNKALAIIFGTLIGLVVLSTAAVIYNIFHISVLERIRQFGLLRTLGATPSQIRGLVFREATTLAAIGIPLGLACGWGALWLVIRLMLSAGFSILQMDDFQLTWHNWIMGGSVLVGLLSVYLAAWLPARKASSVSPVEAVRGAGSIVRESFRRSRLPSPLQAFGVGGKMASKNIRRNRSKYRITTFSIIISVTLFIVFHYFTQESLNLTVDSNEENRIAFSVYKNYSSSDDNGEAARDFIPKEQIERIAALPGVRGVYGNYSSLVGNLWIPANRVNPQFLAVSGLQMETKAKDGADYRIGPAYIRKYDEARLQEAASYLIAGTADPQKLEAQNAVLIVTAVKPQDPKTGKRTLLNMADYKVGDKLLIDWSAMASDPEKASKPIYAEVTVGGILSQSPFGSTYQEEALSVMAPMSVFDKLAMTVPGETGASLGMEGIDVALEDGADAEAIRQALQALVDSLPNARLVDVAAQQKQERQFNLQMQIFVYGFLTVIGVIGSLNIINTVQTNLLLRRREFGLLQAVGMTMGQLKRMASLEGIWFGVLGSFWGLVFGIGLSYFLFVELSGIQGMPFRFPWGGALIACGAALAVGLLSVQGPLRRMSKLNLIESLREET